MASAPGWYVDPTGRKDLRYWDGSAWTQRTKSRAKGSGEAMTDTDPAKKRTGKSRSEICFVSWFCRDQTAQERRIRKDYPYEIWFIARALGPNGLYVAAESDIVFNALSNNYYHSGRYNSRFASEVPWSDDSAASLDNLAKKLWDGGWEPSSGGGKNALWYEYRFRRSVTE